MTSALRKLSRRIYSVLFAHVAEASDSERQRLQLDALYVTRVRPTNAAFFDWRAMEDVRVEPSEPGDAEWMADLIERHEGPASAALARSWWRIQPAAFHVFRGADDARFGFLALLDIGQAGAPAIAGDPAIASALAFVERHGPVGRGEGVVYLRWWMHAESYQAVTAAINLTAMHVVSECVTRPGIAWNFVAMADPSFWAAHFEGVNFARVPEADFEVAGRRSGVFAHDWRIEPPADWMMGARTPMPFSSEPVGIAGWTCRPRRGRLPARRPRGAARLHASRPARRQSAAIRPDAAGRSDGGPARPPSRDCCATRPWRSKPTHAT